MGSFNFYNAWKRGVDHLKEGGPHLGSPPLFIRELQFGPEYTRIFALASHKIVTKRVTESCKAYRTRVYKGTLDMLTIVLGTYQDKLSCYIRVPWHFVIKPESDLIEGAR